MASSVFDEYKALIEKGMTITSLSEDEMDRLDVLWIQLSTEEVRMIRELMRRLWVDWVNDVIDIVEEKDVEKGS